MCAAVPANALQQYALPTPVLGTSVSHSSGAFSPLVNPVFSDTTEATAFSYRQMRYHRDGSGIHQVLLNTFGFSFSGAWFNALYDEASDEFTPSRTRLYTIGKGLFWENTIGIGANYSFTDSDTDGYDDYRSWTLGFLLRPFPFLSFGYTARDVNNPSLNNTAVPRTDVFSLSLRPLYHYLTLSVDYQRKEGEDFTGGRLMYCVDITLPNDISLFASADSDSNYSAGISLPFDFSGPSASAAVLDYSMQNRRGAGAVSVFGVTITNERLKAPAISSPAVLKIHIRGNINEIEGDSFIAENHTTFNSILRAIREASRDSSIRAILMTVDAANLGVGQIQEIREELRRFRECGKKVYAVCMVPGNRAYYLSAAADRIYYSPAETFQISGLAAEVYFFKALLDKIGIRFESVRKGRYKFFNEPFTSTHMSRDYRESLLALMTSLNDQYVLDVAADRHIGRERIEQTFAQGILSPEEARAAGLVDSVAYPSAAEREVLREREGGAATISHGQYLRQYRRTYQWGPIPKIAVIHVTGSIIRGRSDNRGIISAETTGDETYQRLLKAAFTDKSVVAVVVRVDSGGGSAAASDLMRQYLVDMKKENPKPVVFSFGNIAASGGYYIATTGDRIYADRGSLTGSIGVISGKVSLKRLYEKIGVTKETVKMSEFSDIFTESRDLSPEERKVLEKSVEFIYDRFTTFVREARKLEASQIPLVAEGRVFSGTQAMEKKLVDECGGIMAAVEYARLKAGIRGRHRTVHLPRKKIPLVAQLMELSARRSLRDELPAGVQALLPMIRSLELIYSRDESALYLFPYRIVIK
jgi:protease-4